MIGLGLIEGLEGRLVNAWPCFETEFCEGWLLRFAEGYSKRANAATPIVPGAKLDADLIRHIAGCFETRGIAPCFRLTGTEDPGCDAALGAFGYELYDPSLVMVAELGLDLEADEEVRIGRAPKPRWIAAAAAAYGGDKVNADKLGRIVRLIRQPAAFATLSVDEEDAAWGLAVAERGYVGLYDIVIAPHLRGLGLGRRLVRALLNWGREAGATRGYLQVREANEIAHQLYGSLGFETAYRYTHRVPPERE